MKVEVSTLGELTAFRSIGLKGVSVAWWRGRPELRLGWQVKGVSTDHCLSLEQATELAALLLAAVGAVEGRPEK